ncbi:MAG: hypothetical protein M1816_003356 [Peltula sp. TS41687]|nr:MAG: hypothetical protein M1816_003356 [Peltula sp. TS41687]
MRTHQTRLLLLSDTHTSLPRTPLPRADIALHAGDISMMGHHDEYVKILTFLRDDVDAALKLVIAGNHDVSLDPGWFVKGPGRFVGAGSRMTEKERREMVTRVRELWCSDETKRAGVVLLDEGVREFRLKGGVNGDGRAGVKFAVYASPYQPEFGCWAFQYPSSEDRFNPVEPGDQGKDGTDGTEGKDGKRDGDEEMDGEMDPDEDGDEVEDDDDDDDERTPLQPVPDFPAVDIMLTHGPPLGRLDRTVRGQDVGCPFLAEAVERAKPRLHCFGHIHESWGAERVRWRTGEGGEEGIEEVSRYEPDKERIRVDRVAHVDVSGESKTPLVFGKETLFVNACINTVRYQPVQAPWVIDLDLPADEEG